MRSSDSQLPTEVPAMRTILDTRVFEKANATTFVTDRKVVASESIGLILDLNDALK
jgi:hypothetical protein